MKGKGNRIVELEAQVEGLLGLEAQVEAQRLEIVGLRAAIAALQHAPNPWRPIGPRPGESPPYTDPRPLFDQPHWGPNTGDPMPEPMIIWCQADSSETIASAALDDA